jgi:outer membrane lipoprotein-sorting protein
MRILWTLLCILTLQALFAAGQTGGEQSGQSLSAQQIASRLAENNRKRQLGLQSFTGQREYHLLYTGFPGRHEANLVVDVKYEAPADKKFTIVSQSGSGVIVNRVFKKLMETEQEALDADSQRHIALNEENYKFELLGQEDLDGRASYLLRVSPRKQNKLLYRGKIWVDAADFAVARIEAEPANKPSFWISNTAIHLRYCKIGDFWLPQLNRSSSDVRLGGHAVLSIEYRDYKVAGATAAGTTTVAEQSALLTR